MSLFLEQLLNAFQFSLLLFLLSAGLTLVFGIMNFVNLAHGSLYMLGAYFAISLTRITESFALGVLLAAPAAMILGMILEYVVVRHLYRRTHLDHVLATFGLILFFDEAVRLVWGAPGMTLPLPPYLSAFVEIFPGSVYPTYRFAIIAASLLVGSGLYYLVQRTRIGMLIRAGASNREMVAALGVNINALYTIVFGLGAALAAFAGAMAAPIVTAQIGMGEEVLILTFVVIVIGGIGSVRGAFAASLLVGASDTIARAYLPAVFGAFLSPVAASTAAPAVSAMFTYLLMAVFLVARPEGLFPVPGFRK